MGSVSKNSMNFFFSIVSTKKIRKSNTQKIVTSFLVVAFLMQPIAVAFAQEVASQPPVPVASVETSSDQTASPSTPAETNVSPDTSTPSSSASENSEIGSTILPDPTQITPETTVDANPKTEVVPEIAPEAPKLDTEIPEVSPDAQDLLPPEIEATSAQLENKPTTYDNSNFAYRKTTLPEANASSGALSYSYPIVTPSGRAGVETSLNISYNSSENSNINTMGYGWDFNIPSIERINKQGNIVMYGQDYFSSSLSGELASTTIAGLYQPRVDSGEFLKYVYNATTTSWKVYDKNGRVYTFGSVATSRNADPANASRVAKWYLDEVRDSNGNYISYNYTVTGGQVYPTEITYTNHQANSGEVVSGIYKVTFVYEDTRSDSAISSYKFAFLSTNAKRLKIIEIRVSDILKKKYEFAYGVGVNGVRSILSGITETGYDSQNVATTLPQTTFEYTKGFENPVLPTGLEPAISSGTFSWALGSFFYGPERGGDVYADLNGDGYTDSFVLGINPYESNSFNIQVEWNKLGVAGSNSLPNLRFAYHTRGSNGSGPEDSGARIADLNGDGLTDFFGVPVTLFNAGSCTNATCPPPPNPPTLYLNSGINSLDNSYTYISTTTPLLVAKGSFVADTNGDGLPEIYGREISGWEERRRVGAMDVNGDGLDDTKTSDRYSSFRIGTGDGGLTGPMVPIFGDSPDHTLMMTDGDGNDMGVRYLDINADGLVDVLRGWVLPNNPNFDNGYTTGDYNEVYINTGNGFVKSSTLKSPYFIKINPYNWKWNFSYQLTDYYDTNGDTLVDIPSGPTTRADILKTITYPQGGKTSIDYKTSASGERFNLKLPTVLWIVSKITTTDGVGGEPQVDTYTYADGQGFFNGSHDRKFAGFGKVTKDSGKSVTISYFHQGNGDNSSTGETGDSYGKIGSVYKTEVFDREGKLFARNQNIYSESPLAGVNSAGFTSSAPVFVYLSKKIEESFDGTTSHKDHATEYSYDTSNGNLISSVDYGEVTSASTNTLASYSFVDIGNDKTITNVEYASNAGVSTSTSIQIHYEVSHKTTNSQSGNVISESKTYFDDLPFGQLLEGNGTKQESLISDGRYSITSATYNPFALVATSTDANGNSTGYSYDTYNLFPISVTNHLNQKTTYLYDYALGKPIQITDSNNQIYSKAYDAFGRTLQEKQPDGNSVVVSGISASLVTKTIYQYTDTPNNISVKKVDFINSTLSNETYTYFDGIGREIQTRKQSENPNTFIVSDIIYDSEGRVGKQSLPYFSDGSGKTSATSDSSLYTSFTYDALGRNVQKTDALGTTNTYFSPGQTKITDTLGKSKIYYKDVFGRLTRVDEFNYPDTYSTFYEYDSLGNLVKITDALQNIRNFTYDFSGRRLLAEDLHTPSDTAFGVYSYQYDDVGNLTGKTDPNGTRTVYTYDSLNRLGKIEAASSPISTIPVGVRTTYTYDACDFGIGKLCAVSYADDSVGANLEMNSTSYAYTPAGQAKTETKIIGGKTFISSYLYNLGGGVTEMTGVDSKKTSYIYNSAGLVDSISATGVSTTTPVTQIGAFDYSPLGQLKTITYGNGVVATNTYDPARLYRLTNKKTLSANNLQLQNLSYTYDSVGNILQIVDNSETNTKKIATYKYDDLYRLVDALATPNQQSFAYNPLGNIISKIEGQVSLNPYSLDVEGDSSQYASVPTNAGISGGPITIEAWIKPESLPSAGFNIIASQQDAVTNVGYSLSTSYTDGSHHINFDRHIEGVGGARIIYDTTLSVGSWYHIVGTYNGTEMNLYLATSTSSGHTLVKGPTLAVGRGYGGFNELAIGKATFPNPHNWDGLVDDVRFWNTSRSLVDLDSNYLTELSGNEANLVAYYKLGNNYYDFTANAYHLTAFGAPIFNENTPFSSAVGKFTTTNYFYDGTDYANPHASTVTGSSVATNTLSYDKSGNLISFGNISYIYDYNNRLISVANGLATSTYAYDHGGARVKVSDGKGGVTLYPSKYFNAGYNSDDVVVSETSHVFVGDTLLSTFDKKTPVAPKLTNANAGTCVIPETGDFTLISSCTIVGSVTAPASVIVPVGKVLTVTADSTLYINLKASKLLVKKGGGVLIKKGGTIRQLKPIDLTSSSSLSYHLIDHLGSITLSTDTAGKVVELIDYYPYGSIRADEGGSPKEQRKYIGQEFDASTGLSYLNARYYDGARGQFLNQDPVFWEVGMSKEGKEALLNPQVQNSYSYGGNNPVTYKDPDGRFLPALVAVAGVLTMYAPQITSFAQSLLTPLGQVAVSQVIDDVDKGNYGMAAVGALTAGEIPAGKVVPVFEGIWSKGTKLTLADNAIYHAGKHAEKFGFKNTKEYIKGARDFVTDAMNGKTSLKIDAGGVARAYDSLSNSFAVFQINPKTGGTVINTFFKPSAGQAYFDRQAGQLINNLQSLSNSLKSLLKSLK